MCQPCVRQRPEAFGATREERHLAGVKRAVEPLAPRLDRHVVSGGCEERVPIALPLEEVLAMGRISEHAVDVDDDHPGSVGGFHAGPSGKAARMTYMGIERRAGADRRAVTTTTMPAATTSGRSASSREYDARMNELRDSAGPVSLVAPGLLIGLGLGGLLDGIVFHRLLDWHHVRSSETPMTGAGITDNLRGDGVFDIVAFAVLVVGIALLWQAARRLHPTADDRTGVHVVGWTLVGWALFNIVEGVIVHLALGWHHVNETAGANETAWDWGLLIASVLIGLLGLAMTRTRADDDLDSRMPRRGRPGPSPLPDRPPRV